MGNDHERPHIPTKGERLDSCSYAFPEREPVQSALETSGITQVWCAQHEWRCLRGGQQDAESEERCPIEGEAPLARETWPVEKKDDRRGDAEDRPPYLLNGIEDQSCSAIVCPPAKRGPGKWTHVLPRWHFDQRPVHATARQAIKGNCQYDAPKQKGARSRGYQRDLAAPVRIMHVVYSPCSVLGDQSIAASLAHGSSPALLYSVVTCIAGSISLRKA